MTPEFPEGIYHYYVSDSFPYFTRCVKGEVSNQRPTRQGGGADGQPQGQARGQGGSDLAAAAATLGISEEALRDALGASPPDFEAAAATLGVTVEALQDALDQP